MTKRHTYSPKFKTQVVLESLRSEKSQAAICREHGISSDLLSRWRQQFLERAHLVFADRASPSAEQAHMAELERLVGQRTFELAAAKKLSRLLNSPSAASGR